MKRNMLSYVMFPLSILYGNLLMSTLHSDYGKMISFNKERSYSGALISIFHHLSFSPSCYEVRKFLVSFVLHYYPLIFTFVMKNRHGYNRQR